MLKDGQLVRIKTVYGRQHWFANIINDKNHNNTAYIKNNTLAIILKLDVKNTDYYKIYYSKDNIICYLERWIVDTYADKLC